MDRRPFRLIGLGGKPDAVAGRKVRQHGGNLVSDHSFSQRQIGAHHGPLGGPLSSGLSPLVGAFLGQENGPLSGNCQASAMPTMPASSPSWAAIERPLMWTTNVDVAAQSRTGLPEILAVWVTDCRA